MGAAATFELQKPVDASDIRASNSLTVAHKEVIRLRHLLGHIAKDYGMEVVDYEGCDLVHGKDEQEDFERCVGEIAHIRSCLVLNTQASKRRGRGCIASRLTSDDMESPDHSDAESSRDVSPRSSFGHITDEHKR